ncbi:metallophosphoesterase [Belliella kenyensis]|uniref:Metallophosphoesterase n=1 Tax=Belliella kenyensis TaxID=1472724 RepID=A0ABV8EFQ2_9BACT|nr:metallophosphoesterase [Belliella kenyensis]MCH7401083.1 metallophosphoesterase [Belliella kenyensis]MDN3604080.1 metallophosphoesterase [Belliella kenyensis]
MALFIIGDVHGCFHTYLKLLDQWNPKHETLIQVGDLIDRGNLSPLSIRLSFEIKKSFPDNSFFLRGNHEQMMIDHFQHAKTPYNWLQNGGEQVLSQFENLEMNLSDYQPWINELPLHWENDHVLISHAGFSGIGDPFEQNNSQNVLWSRRRPMKLDKVQIIGHTPLTSEHPQYYPESNTWNIDTGAYKGNYLSGIKLEDDGTLIELISIPTDMQDIK